MTAVTAVTAVLAAVRRRVPVNPVLERELRQRLRGRAAWVSLTLYLVVLGLLLRLVYDVVAESEQFAFGGQFQQASTAGRSIFHWLLFVMLALICFIVPGLTAGAVAGERERQTLVPLQITLLSARSIVVGKLLASLAFVVLLVLAALPFLSVSFLLGGVALAEVMKGTAMVLVVAVAVAALSLACSSVVRRTQTATVTAYGLVGMLVIGTVVVYAAQRSFDDDLTGRTEPTVLLLNPFAATAEVIRGRTEAVDLSSPFTGIQELLDNQVFVETGQGFAPAPGVAVTVPGPIPPPPVVAARERGQVVQIIEGPAGVVQQFAAPEERRPEVAGMPFWAASLGSFTVLTVAALLVAIRRVSVPVRGRAE
ncbi:MAG: ABC transporter permease [Acidimicrobiia bacterium]